MEGFFFDKNGANVWEMEKSYKKIQVENTRSVPVLKVLKKGQTSVFE